MPQDFHWDTAPINQRRRILRMVDLWDGNTYAALQWNEFPEHIQAKIVWLLAYAGLVPSN